MCYSVMKSAFFITCVILGMHGKINWLTQKFKSHSGFKQLFRSWQTNQTILTFRQALRISRVVRLRFELVSNLIQTSIKMLPLSQVLLLKDQAIRESVIMLKQKHDSLHYFITRLLQKNAVSIIRLRIPIFWK